MAFKIVETVENGKKLLSAIPSAWEKDGYLYWPPIKRVTLLQKLLNDSNSQPGAGWSRGICKLKRQGILTFAEAEHEIDSMENYSETSSDACIFDNASQINNQRKRKVTQRASKTTLPPLSPTSYNDMAQELLSCQQPSPAYQQQQQSSSAQEQDTRSQHNIQRSILHIQPPLEQSQISIAEDIESNEPVQVRLDENLINIISPTLQYIPNEEVYEVQEITLSFILQEMNKNFSVLLENQQKIIHQLSKQQTTIDHLLESFSSEKSGTNTDAPGDQNDKETTRLKVIETVQDLDDLETKLLCKKTKSAFIETWSTVCETSGKKKGGTCSYRLVDKMISRHLLTEFSWGGGTRQREGLKFAFKKYKNILQTFYEIILKADREFTYTDCEAFFKTVIRNSTRRVEVMDNPVTRMSAGRKRQNKTATKENRTFSQSIEDADLDIVVGTTNNDMELADKTIDNQLRKKVLTTNVNSDSIDSEGADGKEDDDDGGE